MSKKVATFEFSMVYEILSRAKAKELKGLSLRKERERQRLFLIEGEKGVRDTIDSFSLSNLICTRDWSEKNINLTERYKDKILISDRRGFEIISSLKSVPEVIAVYHLPELDFKKKLNPSGLVLLLDEIQDPGNLGTIVRTCDWYGIYDIYASENTVDVYSPKVVQSTMGSLARVRVHYTDLEELINANRHIKVYGTLLDGEPVDKFRGIGKGMILMGNEGRGISPRLKNMVDAGLTIPPVNPDDHPDSLNVAIATAIVISHLIS